MVGRTPANHLARFPAHLQSALAIEALTVIDATHNERAEMHQAIELILTATGLPPTAKLFLRSALGVVRAVESRSSLQAIQNAVEAAGDTQDEERP